MHGVIDIFYLYCIEYASQALISEFPFFIEYKLARFPKTGPISISTFQGLVQKS